MENVVTGGGTGAGTMKTGGSERQGGGGWRAEAILEGMVMAEEDETVRATWKAVLPNDSHDGSDEAAHEEALFALERVIAVFGWTEEPLACFTGNRNRTARASADFGALSMQDWLRVTGELNKVTKKWWPGAEVQSALLLGPDDFLTSPKQGCDSAEKKRPGKTSKP